LGKNNTDKLNLSRKFVSYVVSCCEIDGYREAGQAAGQIQFVRVIFFVPFRPRNDGFCIGKW